MDDFLMSEDVLLTLVDEYTLYCHYLEFEPEIKLNYLSPLRADDQTPSFGIFNVRKSNREYFWKDSGGRGNSGDIFKLVQLLYGYETRFQAMQRILSDFSLGAAVEKREKVIRNVVTQRSDADIRIKPREFYDLDYKFWQQFNVSENILKMYRTTPFSYYFMKPDQVTPYFPPFYAYAYRVYDRYQLYFPYNDKGRKFRMDLQDTYVHGIEQLTYSSDTLIITKSRKDIMCLRSFGYEAVAPRSENTPMPEKFFTWADRHYKRKLVLFDNDMKHRGEWYPYDKIYVPEDTGCKDISDFTRDFSPHSAAELLRQLI